MASRATRRGFGNVRQLPSGNYQARYVGPDTATYKALVTFTNKASAEAWLVAERRLLESDAWTPPAQRDQERRRKAEELKRNTFGAYAEEYLTTRGLKPTTVNGYRQVLETRILPTFAGVPLSEIRVADVKAWHQEQPKDTPSQNAAAYRLLRSVLNAAEADELIDRTPARIRAAATAPVQRKAKPATLAELDAITTAMPERLQLLVVLAYSCGLREGELLELRRKDIDIGAMTVSITRAVSKERLASEAGACENCGRVIGDPKTEAGTRTISIPASLAPMIREHLEKHTGDDEESLLFRGERKDHMSVRYLMSRYDTARESAGRPDLTLHGLRHTALSLAGQLRGTPAQLKHRAGHSSLAAMAIYQHSDLEQDRELTERIDATLVAHRKTSRSRT